MHKFLFLIPLLLGTQFTYALQVIEAGAEGQTYHAQISRDEMTQLSVKDGRITSMNFPDGRLTVERNEEQGFAILRARDDNPVSLIITTNSGQSHSIYLTPVQSGLDTILIKEKPSAPKTLNSSSESKSDPQTKQVKRLILAMARSEKDFSDYLVEPDSRELSLWQEANFRLVDRYVGPEMSGMRFLLTNVSTTTMRLGEQEFYKQGVIAVSIDRHVLSPGETTYVYVVKVRNDG